MSMMSTELTKVQIIAKKICAKITDVRSQPYGIEIAERSGNAIVAKLKKENKHELASAVANEINGCHDDLSWNF